MRHPLLLCLVAATVSAYNLVVQQIELTGDIINNGKFGTCDKIKSLKIAGLTKHYGCFLDDATKSLYLLYKDEAITLDAKKISFEIANDEGEKFNFNISPAMTTGVNQEIPGIDLKPTYVTASTAEVSTVTTPTTSLETTTMASTTTLAASTDPSTGKPVGGTAQISGQGPVLIEPVDSLDEDARLRRKAEAEVEKAEDKPAEVDSTASAARVRFMLLDEPGNAAAVWAAVIEGIILLLLLLTCFYFFCIAPRRRSSAAASNINDPFKTVEPNNYTVSYDNSGYSTRIDAFQNPPAPPRPANTSSYMNDFVTDNVNSPASNQPKPAPVSNLSSFQPTHQRFDSSGLVTVNLS